MAFYFFMMGLMLALFPQFLTQVAGEQHGIILGMLRGAGGSIIPYSLIYILIAIKPLKRGLLAYIIALANVIAIVLDFTSVFLKEYLFIYAMLDVPFELLSLFAIVIFYSFPFVKKQSRTKNIEA
jgi:hypothetical protein